MKKATKLIALVLAVCGIVSCKDMNDLHEAYLDKGEIIYTKKVDSLVALPGNERILIWGILEEGYNIDEIVVSWNDGQGMQAFPYSKSSKDRDTLELMVEDLEEGNYEFQVFSRDHDGNQSIPVVLFGTAYGEIYRSNLVPRAVNGFHFDSHDAHLTFETSGANQRATEIKFIGAGGEEQVAEIPANEETVTLAGYTPETGIQYRTYYVPQPATADSQETSVDQFESDWETLNLPPIPPILESLQFTGILGGVTASWENPDEMSLILEFSYSASGEDKTVRVESASLSGEATVSGMVGADQDLAVTISDPFGFSFRKVISVAPIEAVLLDKSSWAVTDFSSEEPAEGAPNGLASATIDGNLGSFWHSDWANAAPGYPHWFVVDMGAEKTIASFEVFRRQGDGRGQTKHRFYVSDDGVEWTDLGLFDMDPNIDGGQSYAISSNPKARYFKYEAVEGPNFFAALAEINVYGLE